MVQSVSSSNSGQNAVSRLIEKTVDLRATVAKPNKTANAPKGRLDNPKPAPAPQKMLQNLVKMMSKLLETLNSMLTQLMQGLSGTAGDNIVPTAIAEQATPSNTAPSSNTVDTNEAADAIAKDSVSSSSGADTEPSKSIGSTTGATGNADVDSISEDDEDLLPEEATNFRVAPKPSTQRDPLQAVTDDKGLPSVITEDGYTIHCDADKASWTITGPDGKTTQIWGDPHVVESDNDKWDFKNQSTFKFGNNKVTVEVAPYGDGSATVTSRITVYSGEQRVTIDGIDKAKPHIVASANDGRTHDAALQDGDTYQRSLEPGRGDGEQWKKVASVQ